MPSYAKKKAFRAAYDRWGGLRHFTADELLVGVSKEDNTFPPPKLWPNLFAVGLVWDEIRERLGRPVVLTSGYRAPKYNKAVGGAIRSQHLEARALDGYCKGIQAQYVASEAFLLRGTPFVIPARVDFHRMGRASSHLQGRHTQGCTAFVFEGGVGVYENDGFTHIDIRGRNRTWNG